MLGKGQNLSCLINAVVVSSIPNWEFVNARDRPKSEELDVLLSTSVTRKETRALNEAKKRRLVREYGLFDGTTWKKHPDFLKTDIISKCVENSTFDGKCKRSVDAIDSQLGNQHKNRQYRLHVIYNKFPTHEEVLVDPSSGIELSDWVKLCDKFASEKFQKRREGKNVTAIDSYEIAHYCEKKKKMVSEEDVAVLGTFGTKERDFGCGEFKGNGRVRKEQSAALVEKLKEVAVEQDEMKKCMGLMMKEIQRLSKLVPDKSVCVPYEIEILGMCTFVQPVVDYSPYNLDCKTS
nr:hypothetical protein [Tanacetum cinerariifolium]